MRRMVRVEFLLAIVGVLASAAYASDATVLLERDAEFDRVTAEKGMEGFLTFIAEDAVFFPANAEWVTGREAAGEMWREILTTPGVSLRWQPVKADVATSGDLGYTYGRYQFRSEDPEGKVTLRYGKYVTIWKKQANGSWQVVADIGTPSPAPEE